MDTSHSLRHIVIYTDYLNTGNVPSRLWDDIQQATHGGSNEGEEVTRERQLVARAVGPGV